MNSAPAQPVVPATAVALSFTARELAARLGRAPRALVDLLVNVPARSFLEVRHAARPVAAWTVAELPPVLRDELARKSRGHRTIEDFLCDPGSPWQPDFPLQECCVSDVDHAARLQKALLPFITDEQPALNAEEFAAAGVRAYAAAFASSPISTRHWRRIYRMVLDRLNGTEDFHRLDFFLPLRQTRREEPVATVVMRDAINECFDLMSAIQGCSNPLAPNNDEWGLIQRRACEQFDALMLSGCTSKQAMRRLGKTLRDLPPFVHDTPNAINCTLRRWLAKWREHGGAPEAVIDGRVNNSGNHENYQFPVSDYELIVGTAVWRHDGDVAAAWRELWHGAKLSPATMKHFGQWTRSRKSEVPKAVMQAVRFDVDFLRRARLGARGYNSVRATINVSDCPLPPMLVVSADDLTPDCYYGIEIAPGRDRMVRGQILLFIDVGTLRIIGWVICPAPNYNAVMILGGMTRIFRDIAVPAGVAFEKGIWERANVVKGRGKSEPVISQTAREGRFERLGIKFTHACSPQGKARMERTIKAMQERLRAEPGWCGNDEKTTCPEETRRLIDRVNRGELRARDAGFHDRESFEARWRELCALHNAGPQEGKILKGLSPDEAFEQFFDPEYLPTKFTPELEHLLTEHEQEVKVTSTAFGCRLARVFTTRATSFSGIVGIS